MELTIGSLVIILRGSAKGQSGKIIDMSREYDQIDVKITNGTIRYVGYDDVEVYKTIYNTNRKLSLPQKGELGNLLYEYKRAVSDERLKYTRNNLFKYIEKLM